MPESLRSLESKKATIDLRINPKTPTACCYEKWKYYLIQLKTLRINQPGAIKEMDLDFKFELTLKQGDLAVCINLFQLMQTARSPYSNVANLSQHSLFWRLLRFQPLLMGVAKNVKKMIIDYNFNISESHNIICFEFKRINIRDGTII